MRGPGGMMGPERKLVAQFDKDGDKRLNTAERKAARDSIKTSGGGGRGFGPPGGMGGPGGPGGFGGGREPAKPGPKLTPADVTPVAENIPLYDPGTLRTLFLNFEQPDWEAEMAEFKNSDVELPATLIVDGKTYPNVGVHFRGMSSFGMVPAGSKRSLNLSMDYVDSKQKLLGYKSLNLLNSNGDPTFLSSVLYSEIARRHIPTMKANLVKVVINGESWGIYANVQQFNKDFLAENYPSSKGTRWKVPGSPMGRAGLEYVGDDLEQYKQKYEMKTDDGDKAWKALVELCKVLNETPADQLEAKLKPILDIDGALWFLALDVALLNSDGYWTRASDYNIYRDGKGVFHILPHDMNESFALAGGGPGPGGFGGPGGGRGPGGGGPAGGPPGGGPSGPGGPGGPGGGRPGGPAGGGPGGPGGGPRGPGEGGVNLDPLVGLTDSTKPLRSKLLNVPALREKYLRYVKQIAEQDLDYKKLEPFIQGYVTLIDAEVAADTKKLSSTDAFKAAVSSEPAAAPAAGGRGRTTLRGFLEARQKYLLEHPEIKKLK